MMNIGVLWDQNANKKCVLIQLWMGGWVQNDFKNRVFVAFLLKQIHVKKYPQNTRERPQFRFCKMDWHGLIRNMKMQANGTRCNVRSKIRCKIRINNLLPTEINENHHYMRWKACQSSLLAVSRKDVFSCKPEGLWILSVPAGIGFA